MDYITEENLTAGMLKQIYYGRVITAEISRQTYYGSYITADIYYGRYLTSDVLRHVYIYIYTLWQIYNCRYIAENICLQVDYERYLTADMLRHIYIYTCIHISGLLVRRGWYRWYHHALGWWWRCPQPADDRPTPHPLATSLSYVQVRVGLMCGVESVLCAVFRLCYVQSLVCDMCCL